MQLRRPNTPILKLLVLLVALGAGAWTWHALGASHADPTDVEQRLAGLEPAFDDLKALELGWIESHFSEQLVYAPLAPLPCAEGLSFRHAEDREVIDAVRRALSAAADGDLQAAITRLTPYAGGQRSRWLATLVLGNLLLRDGQFDAAAETLDRLLAKTSTREYFARLKDSATGGSATRTLEGFLSLYYTSGQVRLRQGIEDTELWYGLRYPIGACTALVKGQGRGVVEREPCRVEQWLAAPGCSEATVSSYDLYNNLLVGYLQVEGYHGGKDGRRGEFRRDYEPSPESNPLASVLNRAKESWTEDDYTSREHWLWAISNAESLLRSTGQRPPQNARLAFHLAQLLESARPECPEEALAALERQRDELIRTARATLPAVRSEADRALLVSGLLRLEWLAALRDGSAIEPGRDTAGLPEPQRQRAELVIASLDERRQVERLVRRVLSQDTELGEVFGSETGAWLAAARRDLATALARADEADLAYGVLRVGDRLPAALAAQGGADKWLHVLRASPLGPVAIGALAALAFLAVWLLGLWWALQMRHRKQLFTSFYRREALVRMAGP